MSVGENLLGGPPPTLLPVDPAAQALESGADPSQVVRDFPTSSLAWAVLADDAWAQDRVLESYAFARVGYHRGLDSLRRNGWKGHGPVPWSHEANRGVLRCLHSLHRAASSIGETDEVVRLDAFMTDCDPGMPRA
ncbi:MAG: DUF3151 domain-containing protein [Actinomycetota bacterium]